jgi:hypothetical protein
MRTRITGGDGMAAREAWRISIGTGLLIAGLFGGIAGASAAEVAKLRINNWSGGAFTNDQTGAFSHCAASASYKSGITLLFSVTADKTWSMGFSSPTWEFTPGTRYPVEYWVDDGPRLKGTALAKTNRLAQVFLPTNDSLFVAFRQGQMLRVAAERQTLAFRLTDTSELLSTLLRCANDFTRRAAPANPFGRGAPPAAPPANPFGQGVPPPATPSTPAPKPAQSI